MIAWLDRQRQEPKVMDEYATLLISAADLPSLPMVMQELESVVRSEAPDVQEAATIIEKDQVFTAKLLKLVNSPFYGYTRKVVSIEEAITILGFNALQNLLMATSLIGTLKTEHGIININRFWRHSFGVGVIARHLLKKASMETRDEALICGILHDIGRLIFAKKDPKLFVWFYFEREMVTGLDEEAEYFGINHQDLGRLLSEKWNFPDRVVDTIAHHHTPLDAQKSELLVSAVNIADLLCHVLNIGHSGNFYVSAFYPETWKSLKLTMD